MNIKPGDVYAQLGKVKRFHMFVFVKEYKGRMLFFDIHTGELFLLTYKTVEKALDGSVNDPSVLKIKEEISELEEATSLDDGCCLPLVTYGETKKVTYKTLKSL